MLCHPFYRLFNKRWYWGITLVAHNYFQYKTQYKTQLNGQLIWYYGCFLYALTQHKPVSIS